MTTLYRAKLFFFIAAGVLALSIAFQLGTKSVQAQSTGGDTTIVSTSGSVTDWMAVVLSNGDIWLLRSQAPGTWITRYEGNFYGVTGVVPSAASSLGQLKASYR